LDLALVPAPETDELPAVGLDEAVNELDDEDVDPLEPDGEVVLAAPLLDEASRAVVSALSSPLTFLMSAATAAWAAVAWLRAAVQAAAVAGAVVGVAVEVVVVDEPPPAAAADALSQSVVAWLSSALACAVSRSSCF